MSVIAERDNAVLRHAAAADLPAVDAIAIACWTPIFDSFRELQGDAIYEHRFPEPAVWQENKVAQIRAQFARAPETVWVVERDQQVLAFITFHLDRDSAVGTIGNNGVAPDCAGQGLGTFMYRHVLAHFRHEGMRLACVGTGLDRGHAPARRAYEAVGFDRQVPKVDYWQDLSAYNPGSEP